MRCLILLFVVALAAATPVPYTNCGKTTDHIKIKSVDATPWPPVKGKPLSINLDATLDETLTAATYKLNVKYMGIPLLSKTGDLCKMSPDFTCPHNAGEITLKETETIPSMSPSGTYDVSILATDQNSQELVCIAMKLKM